MRGLGIIFLIIMSFLLVSYDIIPEFKKNQRILVYALVVIPVSGFLFPVDILTAFICGIVGSVLSAIRNFIKNLKAKSHTNKNSNQELNNTVDKTNEIKFDSDKYQKLSIHFCTNCGEPIKNEDSFCSGCGVKINSTIIQEEISNHTLSNNNLNRTDNQTGLSNEKKTKKLRKNPPRTQITIGEIINKKRDNKLLYFIIITIIMALIIFFSFGKNKSASINGFYKGNFYDEYETSFFIKYDKKEAYFSLAGDYFAVYDEISNEKMPMDEIPDDFFKGKYLERYHITMKYNDEKTKKLENGYIGGGEDYIQIYGPLSEDKYFIKLSDEVELGSESYFILGDITRINEAEFPDIFQKNQPVSKKKKESNKNVSKNEDKDLSSSEVILSGEVNTKNKETDSPVEKIESNQYLSLDDILHSGENIEDYFNASWEFTQDLEPPEPIVSGEYNLKLQNNSDYTITIDTQKLSFVSIGANAEDEIPQTKKYSNLSGEISIFPNETFTIEYLFTRVSDQSLLYHKLMYDNISLWRNNIDTNLYSVHKDVTSESESYSVPLLEEELYWYAKDYVDEWNGYDNQLKEEFWTEVNGIQVKYFVFHDGPTTHIVGVYVNPNDGSVVGDYGGIP